MSGLIGVAARRAAARVASSRDLVLVVRPADLDAWRPYAERLGIASRLIASPIMRIEGGACVLREVDLHLLSVVTT